MTGAGMIFIGRFPLTRPFWEVMTTEDQSEGIHDDVLRLALKVQLYLHQLDSQPSVHHTHAMKL